jgi:hypothetical protein
VKTLVRNAVAAGALLALTAGTASAALIVPGFNPDNGAEAFLPASITGHVELFDAADLSAPPGGFEFGFYFLSDPGTRVVIFDTTDVGPGGAQAAIDFGLGRVIDLDASALQSTFAPGAAPLGFYLQVGATTLFSQASLNPGGVDFVETLRDTSGSGSYLVAFEIPGVAFPISLQFVSGYTAVPEPAVASLLLAGVLLTGIGGGLLRRRGRGGAA